MSGESERQGGPFAEARKSSAATGCRVKSRDAAIVVGVALTQIDDRRQVSFEVRQVRGAPDFPHEGAGET